MVVDSWHGDFFLGGDPDFRTFEVYLGLVKFMGKWDVAPRFTTILRTGFLTFADQSSAHGRLLFAIGACIDDVTLCAVSLRHYDHLSTFGPTHWPFWIWKHCPATYLAALAGALEASVPKSAIRGTFQSLVERMKEEDRAC
jgi:hypothetical protein